ncbi:methyl-accepting chemotaxis protein [Shewanella aestuarii]|uniref:Methyl-accepting chemotaxis protein n=1 Tax=Shewanella aestuarii TaxID=1028752 RepID=A0A6G9QPD6_9GAMM|nr:methyl-accepting chemotaxis protein [Shewanella aestuarii]QIR15963.1 methyl-accepting chemotaxis protein [Shewanella aestuarii]
MMALSISKKLNISLTALMLLSIFIGFMGFRGISTLENTLVFISTTAWDAADGAMEGTIGIQGQMLGFTEQIKPKSEKNEQDIKDLIASSKEMQDEALGRMKASGLILQDKIRILDGFIADFEKSKQQLQQGIIEQSPNIDKYHYTLIQSGNVLLNYLEELEAAADARVEETASGVNDMIAAIRFQLVFAVIFSVVLGFAIIWLAFKLVITPLRHVTDELKNISEGEGDLSVRLDDKGSDEIAELSRYFNKFVESIHGIIKRVVDSAEQIANSSLNAANKANTSLSVVHKQQDETSHIATSAAQLSSTVDEIARNSAEAAHSAKDAAEGALRCQQSVTVTMALIDQLNNEIAKSSSVIVGLKDDTNSIGSVLGVIGGIAEQTNLLALNAAIEAARAGEQGRGFAVVADEVRSLANRTQESTQDIQQMIEKLQSGAEAAVDAMSSSQSIADKTAEQSHDVKNVLDEVNRLIDQISSMSMQISTATEEQSSVTNEMSHNIENVNHASIEVSESIQVAATDAKRLCDVGLELKELVGRFKV